MVTRFPGIIVAALIFLQVTGGVWADDTPLRSVGKTVQPLRDVPVRMASEKVDVIIDNNIAEITCRFFLRNEGKPDTLLVGFPRGRDAEIYDFRAWAGDKDLTVTTSATDPVFDGNGLSEKEIPWWKTFLVKLPATGRTIEVGNTYWTRLFPVGGMGNEDLRFVYILKTGALWKGIIGDAEITVTLRNTNPGQVATLSPAGYTRKGNTITWRLKNFEPQEDIEITIMQDVLYERMTRAQELLKRNPKNAEARFLLGTVYFNRDWLGSSDPKAENEFTKAIELDPKQLDARFYLVVIYHWRNSGRNEALYRNEIALLDAILREKPNYSCTDSALPAIIPYWADLKSTRADEWLKKIEQWR
ncbi:MAG: tetratricopeptide repeat protein [Candidatus Latescibacterota bacterium]